MNLNPQSMDEMLKNIEDMYEQMQMLKDNITETAKEYSEAKIDDVVNPKKITKQHSICLDY